MTAPTGLEAKPTLTGERVVLRPFTAADLHEMGPILADPEVIRMTGSAHTTAETLGRPTELEPRVREWYESRAAQPDRLDLAIVDRAADTCVGEIVLNEFSPVNRSCNLRLLIGAQGRGADGRGRGFGTEAIRMTVAHAFAVTDLWRIELGVYSFNPKALRVYEKCGFVVEGRRTDAFRFDGEPHDELVMSVLKPDWEAQQRFTHAG